MTEEDIDKVSGYLESNQMMPDEESSRYHAVKILELVITEEVIKVDELYGWYCGRCCAKNTSEDMVCCECGNQGVINARS